MRWYFNNITSLTTIDIPNQSSAIKGKELKQKLSRFPNINYKESLQLKASHLNHNYLRSNVKQAIIKGRNAKNLTSTQ